MDLKAEQPPPTLLLRFSGSGWLLAFHFGVGKFVHQHFDVNSQRLRFAGCSGGSLIAAALATGQGLEFLYEEYLETSEPCRRNPFRLKARLSNAIRRLAPTDEVWQQCGQKLAVGLAHRRSGGTGWAGVQVTEFRSRQHAVQVLEASNNVPVAFGFSGGRVDGRRYHDGALAGLVPDVSPEELGLNADTSKGPVEPVYAVDVCSWGRGAEGCHIYPGTDLPGSWFAVPPNISVLHTLFLLGFCRAAECFAKADRAALEGLWRPGSEIGTSALPDIVEQIEGLMEDLEGALHATSCLDGLFGFRKRHQRRRQGEMAGLRVPQLPLPKTSEALLVPDAQGKRTRLHLPDDPPAVIAYEKARQVKRHRRIAASQYRRASLQMYLPGPTEPRRKSLHRPTGPAGSDPRRASLQLLVAGGDPRRASIQFGNIDRHRANAGSAADDDGDTAAAGPAKWAASKRVLGFTISQRRRAMQASWDEGPQSVPPSNGPSKAPSSAALQMSSPGARPSRQQSSQLASPTVAAKPSPQPSRASSQPPRLSPQPSQQLASQLSSPFRAPKTPQTWTASAAAATETGTATATAMLPPAAAASTEVPSRPAGGARTGWGHDMLVSDDMVSSYSVGSLGECPTVAPSGVLCLERTATAASGAGGGGNGNNNNNSGGGVAELQAGLKRRGSSGCSNKVAPLPAAQA